MKTKTILLLGSTGMAGHMVYYFLKNTNKYTIIDVSFRTKLTDETIILDAKNKNELENLILKTNPDFIINCIGILIKGSADIENAIYINAYLPHFLKKSADKINATLIHISTDCVFSGQKGNYKEDSFRDADDIYGRSKALGEINDSKHLTIRTSLIGPELKVNGEGLFHWFMLQKGDITGYTNAIWSGVTTLELAKAIEFCLVTDFVPGTVHLTNGIKISKYELLNLFKSIYRSLDINIKEGLGIKSIEKSLAKSITFKYNVPSYIDMLKDQYSWMNTHRNLYSQYKF
jgi:dTDP-4-dehydrorhamnose reductase